MKTLKFILAFLLIPAMLFAQETETEEVKEDRPQRDAYESHYLIDNPTNVVFNKKTLEVQMAHRFGEFGNVGDLGGIWGAANIRIGVTYTPIERIAVGFGTTKNKRLQDFNWKVAALRQTRSDNVPVSVTYYGNFVIDARNKDRPGVLFYETSDRYSFFHQIIIARRFSSKFSFQIAPSLSHYNRVDENIRNDMLALAFGGRYKISTGTAIIAEYSQPLTDFDEMNPEPGLSFGVEFATSSHAFQIFVTNYWGIVPQENYVYNLSDEFLLGFNITRRYNF